MRVVKVFLAVIGAVFALSISMFGQELKPGSDSPGQIGNPAAKFQIEVFNDYQCPTCRSYNEVLKKVEQRYGQKILIIFRNYPLKIPAHTNAVSAAQAVEAAGKQDKFVGMANLIFKNQKVWGPKLSNVTTFVRYAKQLGLNISKFRSDFNSFEVMDRITQDLERARSLGLTGTPSVLLNGKLLDWADTLKIEDIISTEL